MEDENTIQEKEYGTEATCSPIIATLFTEEIAGLVREKTLQRFIQVAMALEHKVEGLTYSEILEAIEKCFNISFPGFRLEKAFNNLIHERFILPITETDPKRYILAEDLRLEIMKQIKSNKELVENVMYEWFYSLKENYGELEDKKHVILEHLQKSMAIFVEYFSHTMAFPLEPLESDLSTPKTFIDIEHLQRRVEEILCTEDEKTTELLKKEIPQFFIDAKGRRLTYIRAILAGNIEIQLQNLIAPDKDILLDYRKETVIYLDTNVVIAMLGFMGKTIREVVQKMLSVAQTLQIKVCITTRTKKEFISLLNIANRIYRDMNGPPTPNPQQAREFFELDLTLDNPFLNGFLEEAASGGHTPWDRFYAKYLNITRLLSDRRIETLDVNSNILSHPRLPTLMELVSKHARGKIEPVRKHDAVHYLIVANHREKLSSPWHCWFITMDNSNYLFDRDARAEEASNNPCFCMSPASYLIWLDRTVPSGIIGKDIKTIYGRLISTLPLRRKEIDSASVVRLIAAINNWKTYPKDLIGNMTTEIHLQQRYREEMGIETPEGIDAQIIKIAEKIGLEALQQKEQKIKITERQVDELKQRILSLEEEHKTMREKIKKIDEDKEKAVSEKTGLQGQLDVEKKKPESEEKRLAKAKRIIMILGSVAYFFLIAIWALIAKNFAVLYFGWGIAFLFLFIFALRRQNIKKIILYGIPPIVYAGASIIIYHFFKNPARGYIQQALLGLIGLITLLNLLARSRQTTPNPR